MCREIWLPLCLVTNFLMAGGAQAEPLRKLTYRTTAPDADDVHVVRYSTARISEGLMRNALLFAPEQKYLMKVVPIWESCEEGRPPYRACGSRDLDAPNFLHNAEVNLRKAQKDVEELRELRLPPELEPTRQRDLHVLRGWVWVGERLLAYLKTKQVDTLFTSPGELGENPESCRTIARAMHARGLKRFQESGDWRNCINQSLSGKLTLNLEKRQEAEWRAFLKAYQATERLAP